MEKDNTRLGLTIGVGIWVLAAAVKAVYTGIIGVLNPFGWLLSLIETIEFVAWLAGGGSITTFLGSLGTGEAGLILAGLFAIPAWIVTSAMGIKYIRAREKPRAYVLGVVWFYPVVAVSVAWWLLKSDASSDESAVAGEPEQA